MSRLRTRNEVSILDTVLLAECTESVIDKNGPRKAAGYEDVLRSGHFQHNLIPTFQIVTDATNLARWRSFPFDARLLLVHSNLGPRN